MFTGLVTGVTPLHPPGYPPCLQPSPSRLADCPASVRHRPGPRHHSSRQRITSLGHPDSGGLGKSHPKPTEPIRTYPKLSVFFRPSSGGRYTPDEPPISLLELNQGKSK